MNTKYENFVKVQWPSGCRATPVINQNITCVASKPTTIDFSLKIGALQGSIFRIRPDPDPDFIY